MSGIPLTKAKDCFPDSRKSREKEKNHAMSYFILSMLSTPD